MSDADRLREAAEVLDSCATLMPPPEGDLDTPADQWVIHCSDCAKNATTADLLRAVADDEAWFAVNLTWQHPTWTAAVALADVILGAGDE